VTSRLHCAIALPAASSRSRPESPEVGHNVADVLATTFTPLPLSEQLSGVALGIVAGLATYRIWHGTTSGRLNRREFGRPLKFILIAFPALTTSWCSAMLGVIALDLANVRNGFVHVTIVALILITFVAAVAGVVLGGSIMGFGRPRWLIPPPLRPGQ
jgi:multisubunit Na+/H+ antiporter MnhE subunit